MSSNKIQTDKVYVDGSSIENGTCNASAGYGVYYGENDSRNYSQKLYGADQSSQRAELEAIYHGLKNALKFKHNVIIYTDSYSSINAINSKDQHLHHQQSDALNSIREHIKALKNANFQVSIEYIRGHSGNTGNEAAHKLAKEAAKK